MAGSTGGRPDLTGFVARSELDKFAAKIVIDGIYTVDTLPNPADCIDMYARVTDLFGVKRDLVLASRVGTTSFWQPVRPSYAAKVSITADCTLMALKTPSVMLLDGALPGLGLFRTLTLSSQMAFPGASFRLKSRMSGLGTLQIAGLNLGASLALALGGSQEFVYGIADGWVQVT